MPLSNNIKQKISLEVIKTMVTVIDVMPENNFEENNPFYVAFTKNELDGKVTNVPSFISLSNWLQGLNTTLEQTFFENVAHILCDGEKREYTSKNLGNLPISKTQQDTITQIINDLSTSSKLPDLEEENRKLLQNDHSPKVKAEDFSVDVFFENNDSVVAIVLNLNSGEMRDEKQKILEGKAALYRLFPGKQIGFYIGLPFDPTVNPANEPVTGYNKPRFLGSIINMNKYFDPKETLVASELWDFLSGQQNTMEEILEIINTISTPAFPQRFQLLTNNSKRMIPEYIAQLQEWNLFSEQELIENNNIILQKTAENNYLKRTFDKMAFDCKGNYNWDRYNYLKNNILN
ncbi:MAG: TdeIII family type II restriction endonuclease [Prevotellaceae bacterium]|jgi:hypothetical protein|nr:TdeIII family type II restriction endonuclease [Prevotellaceae bacterium]